MIFLYDVDNDDDVLDDDDILQKPPVGNAVAYIVFFMNFVSL